MLGKKGICEYLLTIVLVRCFNSVYGLPLSNNKNLTNEEKRGAAEEIRNDILLTGESSSRAKTEKRGVWDIGSNNDHYGGDPPRPSGPHRYGGPYEPSGPSGYGSGYPHPGLGPPGHSGSGYYDDDLPPHRAPGYGYPERPEPDHRPSGYGPHYGSGYGGGYEEDNHQYQDYHGGGGESHGHGIGGYKGHALKKLLLPLAGLAILGVAAAASHNPVLFQLGVANGRRKRSALPPDVYPPNPKVRPRKMK